ncbi:BglG family transcription antiterminator [Brevibacillus fulvus]|uniref:Mannitol operon transcriptional antiterminator n=1 Tax=Brevibacillus fulvus TaxID=1125967 RepID=A0A939BV55_9BACL|nr:BglG family transcription antiterminator [Brevibacillus fulvus]MBM7590311.1 mannitol operon transcriptional antiterminator [Brevibacillus fulvus]
MSQLVQTDGYVRLRDLTEKLQISRRTVYYDLEKINYWLTQNQLDPVQYVRTVGFYVTDKTKRALPAMLSEVDKGQYYFSAKERRAWLGICLLSATQPLFLQDLMDKIGVSRGTTNTELNVVKQELRSAQLIVQFNNKQGYTVVGNELDKRKMLLQYWSRILSMEWKAADSAQKVSVLCRLMERSDFLQITVEQATKIYEQIESCEQQLGIQFTDEMIDHFALSLVIICNRLRHDCCVKVDEDKKAVLRNAAEYEAARAIGEALSDMFAIRLTDDECCYLTINLLGAKRNDVNDEGNSSIEIHHLRRIIRLMVSDFEKQAYVFFQNRTAIEEQMLIHIKPAYYRIKYGLEIENPLTETIKQTYPEIFKITRKVAAHLESYTGRKASEHEIAYLAIYFGGWMKEQGSKPIQRKRALVVCGNGISTSRILQSQLESLFSAVDVVAAISLREYETHSYEVDFVVSTTPLPKRGLPVFVVSPILSDSEKEKLLSQVNALFSEQNKSNHSVKTILDIIKRHAQILDEKSLQEELTQYFQGGPQLIKEIRKPMLAELLTEEMIQLKSEVSDWREAIRLAAAPLLQQQFIEQSYIEAMIESVQEMGPYIVIAPKIAIPHARPEQGVKRLGMSMLRLERGVSFAEDGSRDVNVLIVLAAVDNETHLRALAQLSSMLSEGENLETILGATTTEPIVELIQRYSQSE